MGESVVYSEADLNRYIEKWKIRDGAAGIVVSDFFCDFLASDPGMFLRTMSRNPEVLEEWMERLPDLSFVDRGGCLDLECRRSKMVGALESASVQPEYEAVRDRLLSLLREVVIREID
jgi:hypothetical protein